VASMVVVGVGSTSGVSGSVSVGPEPTSRSLTTTTLGPPSDGGTTTYVTEDGVEMIPQAHGGALQRGNPGNAGGISPTRALREAFRGDLEVARCRLVEILADTDADPKDLIAIFDRLAKYSVGEKREGVVVDHELLNDLFEPVQRCVRDSSELAGIRERWLDVLGQRLRL
jgi:hypothetical protein